METSAVSAFADILKQLGVPSTKSELIENKQEPQGKYPSLFDLCEQDRYRVLKLIEDLVENQEQTDKLKQTLEDEKNNFKQKRNALLKKLDLVSEKHEKALVDIQRLKDKHAESLKLLEEKISTVSQKLENSVPEIQNLRRTNADLQEENTSMRKLNSALTRKISTVKEENNKLNFFLESNFQREKIYGKRLKNKGTLEVAATINRKQFSNSLIHSSRYISGENENRASLQRLGGAGDFVNQCQTQQSTPIVNTIKSPDVDFNETSLSSFAFTDSSKPITVKPPSQQPNLSNKDLSDIEILENLFFRF